MTPYTIHTYARRISFGVLAMGTLILVFVSSILWLPVPWPGFVCGVIAMLVRGSYPFYSRWFNRRFWS